MPYLSAGERRRSIIDAAVELIASEGLASATTRRIAERAKAPLGALHYCFRSKKELVQLVLDRGATTLRASFDSVDPSRGVEAAIRDSVAAFWRWQQENTGLHLALMAVLMARIHRRREDVDADTILSDPGSGESPREHPTRGVDHGDFAQIFDEFGGKQLREKLTLAAEADAVTPAIPIEEIVRFIIFRFDGLVFEYAGSKDRAACQRQTELLADALVMLSLPLSKGVTGS